MEKTYRFTLPQNKEVESTNIRIENGEVFVDVELKEKFQPKDGDFLVSGYGCTFIYSDMKAKDKLTYSSYCGDYRICGGISIEFSNNWTLKKGCRFATPEEKADFLERLEKECKKRWNAEKKCLEDIYVPKFGDIVKCFFENADDTKRNYMICIYPNKELQYEDNSFFNIYNINLGGDLSSSCGSWDLSKIIPASENEKRELFEKLARVGKRWNPETKNIENIRWRAKKIEGYYTINGFLDVVSEFSGACPHEDVLYERGNYFRTPEAAQKVADQIKEIFKNSKDE